MPARVLNDEQVEWAFRKHCEGYTFEEVADALYVNISTIRSEFKKKGLKRTLPPIEYSPDEKVPQIVKFTKRKVACLTDHQVNWAYHYHWKHYTIGDLAVVLGVSRYTLLETFRRHNLTMRYRRTARKPLVYKNFKEEE